MKLRISIIAASAAIAAIILGYLVYVRVAANKRRIDTRNNFTSLVLSIEPYVQSFKRLPQSTYFDSESGKPMYSWRYRIIPYVGSYKRELFHELPWNHPSNSIWMNIPQPYANGGFKEGVWQADSTQIPTQTNIFAITGPDTGFDVNQAGETKEFDSLPNDLILFAEVAQSGKHWMEPGDFDIRTMEKRINGSPSNSISSVHSDGFHVLFADMEIWYLSNRIPFDILSKFFTTTGAETYDRKELLSPFRLN